MLKMISLIAVIASTTAFADFDEYSCRDASDATRAPVMLSLDTSSLMATLKNKETIIRTHVREISKTNTSWKQYVARELFSVTFLSQQQAPILYLDTQLVCQAL